jgi:hypothetical protein
MNKQEIASKCAKFTIEELLSIFKVEAQHICKKPDEIYPLAISTLKDFIRYHGQYVSFI